MSYAQFKKNKFVTDLRDHLISLYKTKQHYTYGEGEFKAQMKGNVYCLSRKDLNEKDNISGFCFRNDLCDCPPEDIGQVLKDIQVFSLKDESIESRLDTIAKSLEIKLNDKKYLIHSFIDEGYAGEISVYFIESFHTSTHILK